MSSVPQPSRHVKSSRKSKSTTTAPAPSPIDPSAAPSSLGFAFHPKPRELAHKGVNRTAQDVYCVLRNWSKVRRGERISYATNGKIAEELRCTDRTIRRAIEQLIEKELIRCVYQDEAKSIRLGIVITWNPETPSVIPIGDSRTEMSYLSDDCSHGVGQKCPGGQDRNVQGGRTEMSRGGRTEMSYIQDSVLPQEEERKNPQPPYVGFGIQEDAVVDVAAPASPVGESSPSSPAGEEEGGPVWVGNDLRYPKWSGSGSRKDDCFQDDDEAWEAAAEAEERRIASDTARAEGRVIVAEIDVERAKEQLEAPKVKLHVEGKDAGDLLRAKMAEALAKAREEEARRKSAYRPSGEEQVGGAMWNKEFRAARSEGRLAEMRSWPYPHWIPDGHEDKVAAIQAACGIAAKPTDPSPT